MIHFQQPDSTFGTQYTAQLLGIPQEDLTAVNHSGLHTIIEGDGQVAQYYIQFDRNSDTSILNKLKLNKRYIAYFRPDEVQA
ncbi:MAG: hypothetical protein EOP49_32400 [Sphingobacteriales bacterium]|nr:MAG: hypothetical protein EOP49_32400 [Sphingobacteriales bacterium]